MHGNEAIGRENINTAYEIFECLGPTPIRFGEKISSFKFKQFLLLWLEEDSNLWRCLKGSRFFLPSETVGENYTN